MTLEQISIRGNRVLLSQPITPWTDYADTPKPRPESPIWIPPHFWSRKDREAAEWLIIKLGVSFENGCEIRGRARTGAIPEQLAVGQRVLVAHNMGFQMVVVDGQPCRIMSALDIICVLEHNGSANGL